MPAPALPQPWRDSPPTTLPPVVGEARTSTITVGKPRTVTVGGDR